MSSSNRPVDGGARVVPAPLTERQMSSEDGAVAGAVRVLVVDDDESFRAAVGAMLLDDERFVVIGLYAANAGWRPRILRVGTVAHVMPQPRRSRRR